MTSTPSWRVSRPRGTSTGSSSPCRTSSPPSPTAPPVLKRAKMLGVVSVIRRNPDGTWHGDMLDGLAFVKAQKDHGAEPEGARVLLVGAGGAGSAIAIALLEAGVRELVIHDADESRVATLIDLLSSLGQGRVSRRAAGSHRLRSGVQRDSHGHGGG